LLCHLMWFMVLPALLRHPMEFMVLPASLHRLLEIMVVLALLRRQRVGAAQFLLRPATSAATPAVGIGATPEVRQKMSPSQTRGSEGRVETRPLTPSGE
jgi:hypothetical protein